ncbi:MAG: cytochrome O ubiquinol oxidase [Gammaproteobacteria bacterium]|nr:cytochrome O ubiquinol oxidase [Gammaproteobacteria bacterium]
MTHSAENPLHHPEVHQASLSGYVANFLITVLVMTAALWLARDNSLPAGSLVGWTSLLALVAVLVQAYLLLHMNWSKAQIWHTVAMILFVPLFVVMIGLTMWMFHGLYQRTAIAMPHQTMAAPMHPAPAASAAAHTVKAA